jgi:hypothetical protein
MTPRLIPATLFGFALAACSAIVPSTAARLALLDPLTADPAQIELVVFLPPGLAVSPGSARLELAATRGDESLKGAFTLADRGVDDEVVVPRGATARGFGLAPADAEKMRALQSRIATWKREGPAKGSLGLSLDGCAVGAGPAADARGTVLIRITRGGPLLPLIQDGSLAELLGSEVLAAIKPCKGAE